MILNTRRNLAPGLAKGPLATILTTTGLVVALGLCCGPRLVLAGQPPGANTGVTAPGEPDVLPAPAAQPASRPTTDKSIAADASPAPGLVALGAGPGPQFNPEIPARPAAPDEVPAPEAPAPPGKPATEYAPKIIKVPKFARTDKPGSGDGSIEERLLRLEKMVRELLEQQRQKDQPGAAYFEDSGDTPAAAKRQAARAAEQAKRAAEYAERVRELDTTRPQEHQNKAPLREVIDRQQIHLQALRKARESLGQELERLNRQIEKLEKERSERESSRPSNEAGASKPPASPAPADPAAP